MNSPISTIWRKLLAILLTLVMAIAVSGCNPTDRTTAAQVPQVVVSVTQDPDTFNYALGHQLPNIFGLTFKGLTSVNGITGELEPELAESWKFSEDKLRVTFTLREGLNWSDGHPLTADDVVFTYNDIVFNKNQSQLLDADGNRVRFTLMSPSGGTNRGRITAQIQRDLSKIGIQVDLQFLDFSTLIEKTSNSLEWECYSGGFIGSGIEPNDGANVWLTEGGLHNFNQAPQPGQTPIQGREVADWEQKIADLFIQGAQEFDEAKRKEIYGEFQLLAQEYLPYIHLINPLSMAAIRDRIAGVKFTALGGAFWNIYELKVAE